jgi:N utilization substance protein A
MRGSRVQSVVQELRGEKIDIVTYNSDPARFVCNAILPAQVSKVLVDEAKTSMELVVPDDQLSLAIGRGGQNVRLAAQLTGWNLEIYSESRLKQLMSEAKRQLLEHDGVTEAMIDTLFNVGYNKLADISLAEVSELQNLPGFNVERATAIIEAAETVLSRPKRGESPVTEEDLERQELTKVRGVGERMADALHAAGYTKPRYIAYETDAGRMAGLSGLELKRCKQILAMAVKWYEQAGYSADEREEHNEERQEFLGMITERWSERAASVEITEGDDTSETSES